MNNKFEGIPPIYLLSLEDHKDRQIEIFRQLKKYGIDRCEVVFGFDAKKEDLRNNHPLVDGRFFDKLSSVDIACSMGHLKMIKHWYDTSDSEYAIFIEDDVDLEISDHWNFNWSDVMSILPNNWNAMQLSMIREDIDDEDYKINLLNKHKEPLYINKQEIDTCSICKEQQCNIQTYCNHTFCESCLTSWIKKNKTCPYCRSLLENKEYYIISAI